MKKPICEECTFIETVERLHEEKKMLEEKLAEERSRLRKFGRMGRSREEEPRDIDREYVSGRHRRIRGYSILIGLVFAGVLAQGFILKKIFRDREIAWNRERDFYNKMRGKDLSHMSLLSQKIEELNQEQKEIRERLGKLISEKDVLAKENVELSDTLQQARAQAEKALERKDEEIRKYLSEIAALKKEIKVGTEGRQKIKDETELEKELKEVTQKNQELLEGLIKANRSNEYLMKKLRDLQKVRSELEEELKRGKKEEAASW